MRAKPGHISPVDVAPLLRPPVRQLLHPHLRAGEDQAGLLHLGPVLLGLPLGVSSVVLLLQLGQHHDQGNLDSKYLAISSLHLTNKYYHLFIKYHFPKCFNARDISFLPKRSLSSDVFHLVFRKFDPGCVDIVRRRASYKTNILIQ